MPYQQYMLVYLLKFFTQLYITYMHLCIPECKRERGTTRQQGGLVSQVSRGEWPGRRLHQQGLKDEKEIR